MLGATIAKNCPFKNTNWNELRMFEITQGPLKIEYKLEFVSIEVTYKALWRPNVHIFVWY